MKFDLQLEQKILHYEREDALVTYKRLTVTKEEFVGQFEKDNTNLCNTMREMIYMFHGTSGYITQMSDMAMNGIYQMLKDHPAYTGVGFILEEKEFLSEGSDFDRRKTVSVDLVYLK